MTDINTIGGRMKRFVKLAVFGLMFTLVGVMLAPQAQAVTWTNHGSRYDRLTHTFSQGEIGQVTLYYIYQTGGYTSNGVLRVRVKPDFAIVSYNMPGTSMSCNSVFREYDGMGFNLYMWNPYNGANFNPARIDIGCDPSTMNSDVQEYEPATTPWLYWGNEPGGGDAQITHWKVNFTLRLNGFPDLNAAESMLFRPNDGT